MQSSFNKSNKVVVFCHALPPLPSLTGWSSRRPQAALAGALRASHSGAAYRGRYAPRKTFACLQLISNSLHSVLLSLDD